MAILMEGPNLVGKSTLGHRLEATGWKYEKEPHIPRNARELLHLGINQASKGKVIIDRWWISDWVYSQVDEGRTALLNVSAKWLLGMVACRRGDVLTLLNVPLEDLESRYQQQQSKWALEFRGMTWEKLKKVAALYQEASPEWYRYMPVTITMDPRNLERVTFLEALAHLHATTAERVPGHGIGTVFPNKVLLIGERVNPNTVPHGSREEPLPFGGTVHASEALWCMLDRGALTPKDVHVINAYKINDVPAPLLEVVAALEPRVIITMGAVAQARCAELGIKARPFPHPAYIEWWEHDLIETWGEELKKLCS
jgi:hypothetical protein